jgi:hypothetical protein
LGQLLLRALRQGTVGITDPGFQLLEEQGLLTEVAGGAALGTLGRLATGLELQTDYSPD